MSTDHTPSLIRGMTLAEYDHKLATLRGLAAELGVPTMPDIHIGVRVTAPDGETLVDRVEQGHSWTRNAWNIFNAWMMDCPSNVAPSATTPPANTFRRGSLTTRGMGTGSFYGSVAGSLVYSRGQTYSGMGIQGLTSAAMTGIIVGTSTEPFHGEDHDLWGRIGTGTGSGQLSYQAQSAAVVAWDDAAQTFSTTYTRQFNNNSTAAIVVAETGLALESGGALLSRDLLATPVSVPVGGQLTITMVLTTSSFSAINASAPPYPVNIGDSYGGGTFIGWCPDWASSPTGSGYGAMNGHNKFALVLAPKAGGEPTARALITAGTWGTAPTPLDTYYGKTQSDTLAAMGAASPVGAALTAANTAVLGGYSDWYIPSYNEVRTIAGRNSLLPAGEQMSNASYWTSSYSTLTQNYTVNGSTAATASNINPSTANITRFVRRVKF